LVQIDNKFYLKGFEKVQLPDELVNKFISCKEKNEDIQSLVNFWKLCLLNPDPNGRQGLFKFIQRQNLIVTPKGYIVCYRQLVKLKDADNQKLVNFAFEEAVRLKKQKASLSKFSIGLLEDEYVTLSHATKKYETFTGKILGTVSELSELFKNKSVSEQFTDNKTRKMKISLGQVVKLSRDLCDKNPKVECSSGLHVGTPQFLSSNNFGSSNVLVLVNPAHVVAVPYADAHKMRVCEYFPCYIIENLSVIKDLDSSKITTYEDNYCDYEIDQVNQILGSKEFDEEKYEDDTIVRTKKEKEDLLKQKEDYLKRKEELMKYYSIKDDLKEGLSSINKIKELIKSRVVQAKKK